MAETRLIPMMAEPGEFVYMVRHPQDDEIQLFARVEDADAYAGLFLGCETTEEPLLGDDFVDEVRHEIAAEGEPNDG